MEWFQSLQQFFFLRSAHFRKPFAKNRASFDVLYMNPRRVTCNDEFDESTLLGYVVKLFFFAISTQSRLCKRFRSVGTSLALTSFSNTLTKMC